ncbi:MAG: type II secretion system protein, partial [Candidatus Gastranaerophilaceae bacterium]
MRGGGNRLSSRSNGFTLAEVLVTLGIIGVVSAMTV